MSLGYNPKLACKLFREVCGKTHNADRNWNGNEMKARVNFVALCCEWFHHDKSLIILLICVVKEITQVLHFNLNVSPDFQFSS